MCCMRTMSSSSCQHWQSLQAKQLQQPTLLRCSLQSQFRNSSICSLFQQEVLVIHTNTVRKSLSVEWFYSYSAINSCRKGLVTAGREPLSTGSERISACALKTLELTHILTAQPWRKTVNECEKRGVFCALLNKKQITSKVLTILHS